VAVVARTSAPTEVLGAVWTTFNPSIPLVKSTFEAENVPPPGAAPVSICHLELRAPALKLSVNPFAVVAHSPAVNSVGFVPRMETPEIVAEDVPPLVTVTFVIGEKLPTRTLPKGTEDGDSEMLA